MMKTPRLLHSLAGLAVIVAAGAFQPATSHADTLALAFSPSGAGGSFFQFSGITTGWTFTLSSPVTITQLGIFDFGNDGLGEAHAVGIFSTAGSTPLVSTTISAGTGGTVAGSDSFGGFRFVPVTPTFLDVGTYNIGAYYSGTADFNRSLVTFMNTAPQVTFVGAKVSSAGPSLANPTSTSNGNGIFGPDFQFTPAPEPGSALLALLGGTVILSHRRRLPKSQTAST